jgi:hypothetical protein
MGYVPKYILKRLIPKDAVKKVEGGVEVTAINVITPIPSSQIPGDPLDIVDIKINGVEMTKPEKESVKMRINDTDLTLAKLREFGDIPVGAKMVFTFPTTKFKVGDEVTIDLAIPLVNVAINFTRTIE